MDLEKLEQAMEIQALIKLYKGRTIMAMDMENLGEIKLSLRCNGRKDPTGKYYDISYGLLIQNNERFPEHIEKWLDEELHNVASRLQGKIQRHIKELENTLNEL